MRWGMLILAILIVGCGTTSRVRGRMEWLVDLGVTKPQLVAEYGEPVASRQAEGGIEVLEFVYGTRSSSRTVTRVVDGKSTSETVVTTVPGKLRIIALLKQGKLVSFDLRPNR